MTLLLCALLAQAPLEGERPEVVRYGVGPEAAHQFGLPCGGTIELVLEPVSVRSRLPELLTLLERGERVRRILTLASGEVELQTGGGFDGLSLTATPLATIPGPRRGSQPAAPCPCPP